MSLSAEYIGQLESEIATRTNEAHELRLQNRALYEENARLNDLARMLLGSPHFSSFLNDMPDTLPSQMAAPQQPQQPQQQIQHQQPAPQTAMPATIPKEATAPRPQDFQMQQNPQVTMAMVPNQAMDASMMTSNGWNSGIDMNYNAPVFAVLDVPAGPELDIEALCGKSLTPMSSEKNEAPVLDLPEIPDLDALTQKSDVSFPADSESDLFADSPATCTTADDALVFDGIPTEKASPSYELVVESPNEVSAADKNRLRLLCQSMHAAFERVSLATSHLQ